MTAPIFEQFVRESLPALMRHGYALTGDTHLAEDLVQDTLVRLAGVWRRVDREGNPLAYARMVMFRIYLSRWRSLRRRPAAQQLVELPAPGDPYAGVDDREALRRGLMALPRLQRAVLVLGYLDDMGDEQIAALLDRRPATIRSLRFRALQALRGRFLTADGRNRVHSGGRSGGRNGGEP
ncbi:MAG: sigma-70 family RNA polymerase sigma factor [Micromonosporaceae bacterium]|nr:sigma-70 family RNA polymerase sigma factor [Micromonosporaceae bacterium]